MWSLLLRSGVTAMKALDRGLSGMGLTVFDLHPEGLRATARRRTGLDDFGSPDHTEALAQICQSLQTEGQLSVVGRLALREHLILALAGRLQRVALRASAPERFAPLRRPVFVVGLPRSGTTLLHRLLAEVEGARALAAWEIRRPLPPVRGWDLRRWEGKLAIGLLRALAPELDRKHLLDGDAAEECVGLFDTSLWTPTIWRFASVYTYLDWYFAQDPRPGYRVYAEMLQLFQAQNPDQRLTLKLPNHTGFVDTLLEVIPEACIVQTHREPGTVLASYNSLMHSVHGVMSDRVDKARSGGRGMEMWAVHIDRNLAARPGLPEGRLLDVDYDALVADPIGTVARIHAHFGLPLTDADRAHLAEVVAERPQHRFGKHVYALEDAGLDQAQVDARFGPYIAAYLKGPR